MTNQGGVPQDQSLKILVCGDVEGKLTLLYDKVKSIQSKVGKFDLLFCVGEFFAESEQDNQEIHKFCAVPDSIPIQTYILGTSKASRQKYFEDVSGYDLCPDKIIYLGPKGFYSTLSGLSFVYLSGREEKPKSDDSESKRIKRGTEIAEIESGDKNVEFTARDVDNLIEVALKRSEDECIDILLTNQWPKYIEQLHNQPLENNLNSEDFGSELVSNLAMKIKPRYHFAAGQNVFLERLPYRNHTMLMEREQHVTRFLSLARCNKANKPKYLYAFNIIPAKKMDYVEIVRSQGVNLATDCPYKSGQLKEMKSRHDEPTPQYFYDPEQMRRMNEMSESSKRKFEASKNRQQEPCWFCLGGAQIDKHLIVAVGDKCYLAYAKGAINKDNLLIIPIDHVQSSVHAEPALLDDIDKFKQALRKYFKSKNKAVVFYERNYHNKHMQIQVYGVKSDKTYLLRDAFLSAAKEQEIHLNEIPEGTNLAQVLSPMRAFFHLELPNDEDDHKVERFLCEIRGAFPITYGRDVMASEMLLNCPDRIDWKQCVVSQADEKAMTVEFRESFKKFDPSL